MTQGNSPLITGNGAAVSLIAGNGTFPLMFIRAAHARGLAVHAVALHGETLPQIKKEADKVSFVEVAKLQALIDVLKSYPSKQVALAGGVGKLRFFRPVRPDARALAVAKRLLSKKDDTILRAVAQELESEGLEVISSTGFLEEAMARQGQLSPRAPSEEEARDMRFGFELAKQIGAVDIGQTVVVKDQIPIAIEAIEGTDVCMKRAGHMSKGGVVVKVVKPGQDLRFDLPAVGPRTITVMRKAGLSALALEAGHVLIIDAPAFFAAAAKAKISVVGL